VVEQRTQEHREELNRALLDTRRDIGVAWQDTEVARPDPEATRHESRSHLTAVAARYILGGCGNADTCTDGKITEVRWILVLDGNPLPVRHLVCSLHCKDCLLTPYRVSQSGRDDTIGGGGGPWRAATGTTGCQQRPTGQTQSQDPADRGVTTSSSRQQPQCMRRKGISSHRRLGSSRERPPRLWSTEWETEKWNSASLWPATGRRTRPSTSGEVARSDDSV
jgi:hypothetical protein